MTKYCSHVFLDYVQQNTNTLIFVCFLSIVLMTVLENVRKNQWLKLQLKLRLFFAQHRN